MDINHQVSKKILNKKISENNKILDEDECFEKFWHNLILKESNKI